MKKYSEMSVTELDKMYWESYGTMQKNRDSESYRTYCEIGGEIIKEYERRGLIHPSDIANAIEEERKSN